jgi:light-regulated signal transduction histidine kinase (bacteriophytochrome)
MSLFLKLTGMKRLVKNNYPGNQFFDLVKRRVLPLLISAGEKKTVWEVPVADNGIGINKQYHDKIFVIFQRLHTQKKDEGSGIGLAHQRSGYLLPPARKYLLFHYSN